MLCSRSIKDIWFFDQAQGQDGWILAKLFFAFLRDRVKVHKFAKKNEANTWHLD